MTPRFRDREDAGDALAEAVMERAIDADIAVAIPRGGLPLGRAVADALGVELDVVVAKKIGAPGNPEYAIGAVASDGSVWRNEPAIADVGEEYFERTRREEMENAQQKLERYRGTREAPALEGARVVVVDDGIATGSTVRACLAQIQRAGPKAVILAVPVAPPDTLRDLEASVSEVVCLESPDRFRAVGQVYDRFDQVSDREAIAYLRS